MIPTPHISAKLGEIAKTVLMPGDPLRAKFIAENFLEDVKCFNKTRNMLGFTGRFKEKEVSVMASGMGMPSMGIYSFELFNFYKVDNIIRIGSAGAINENINLNDIIIALGASTDSNYVNQYNLNGCFAPIASYRLVKKTIESAEKLKINLIPGNILSSDVFYDNRENLKKWARMGVLAVEMESASLYMNAAKSGKNALSILTVTDLIFENIHMSAEERQNSLKNMINVSLKTIIDLN